MKQADVVLVCPPVAPIKAPSFGLSLLKAELTKVNINCYVDYASIHYLNAIGSDIFKIDWMNMDSFFVEYIFALVADIRVPYAFDEVLQLHMNSANPYRLKALGYDSLTEDCASDLRSAALNCIEAARLETERTVERILAKEPKIVGCSVITSQLNAGLAILKRIKELRPDIVTIIGGYHCFGESGVAIIREFPYLDYVFSGESDDLIGPFCASILKGEEPILEYGILKQGQVCTEKAPHRVLKDMNLASIPDYSDFLELMESDVGRLFIKKFNIALPYTENISFMFEASRGCWWGAKCPCTFCGLNGALQQHRCKDADVFLKQLAEFVKLYNFKNVTLTDTLLPMSYMKDVVPDLAQKPLIEINSEIKTIMTEADIALLGKAGYTDLTIGVESLSDHVLQLMHKGTLAINNLATIKYCMKYHIRPSWNILTSFPGETAEDYQEQLDLLPLIEHFTPCVYVGHICYVRNNEYVKNPAKYGVKMRPSKGMYCISPANEEYVLATATVFELAEPLEESTELKHKRQLLTERAMAWVGHSGANPCYLDMRKHEDYLKIIDTRACRKAVMYKLYGVEREVYLYCEQPRVEQLILKASELAAYTEQEIKEALNRLTENKLLVKIKNSYLALAVEIDARDYMLRYLQPALVRPFSD